MLNLTQNKKQIRRTLNTIFTITLAKSKTYSNTIGSAGKSVGRHQCGEQECKPGPPL